MADTPATGQPCDDDTTPLERAVFLHLAGSNHHELLEADDEDLLSDLLPWLDALPGAAAAFAVIADENSGSGRSTPAPISQDDPVALMLGLVPDPDTPVEGRKLAQARRNARLQLSGLVDRLCNRGWPITTAQAAQWERGAPTLAPALVAAISDELGVDSDSIVARRRPADTLAALFDDAAIAAFMDEWAAEAGLTSEQLQRQTSDLLQQTAWRNRTTTNPTTLIAVLRALRATPNLFTRP